jgi:hypothetical protein
VVIYSLAAGAVAMVVGAAASLLVGGPARMAVWCTVAGIAAVTAGVVHQSSPVSACRSLYRRWLSRLSGS